MGVVIGTPGGSLAGAPAWAANPEVAAIGAAGEQATARVLDDWVRGTDAAVLHDLAIPGSRANIDHAVLGARELWLIDTKVWRGRLWTFGGVTRRGLEPFPVADRKTLPLAVERTQRLLARAGSGVRVRPVSLLVIHPTGTHDAGGPGKVRWYRPVAADPIIADRLHRTLGRRAPRGAPEPVALRALERIVNR